MALPSTWLSEIATDPTVWFGFIRASGSIEGAQQQIQMEDRPGIDGFLVWLMGLKAEPFQMQTETDFTSKSNALAAYVVACAAVGTKKILRRYSGGLGQVVVLHCSLISIQPSSGTVNGLAIAAGGNGVVMTLNWTLRGVS